MEWFILFLIITGHFSRTYATCFLPAKFYVDCGQTRTASAANIFCLSHQMTVANLTNGSVSLASDILSLNNTLRSQNCNGNFWFSSGNQTGLAANVNDLGGLLNGVLSGVLGLVLCLLPLFLCPVTTTPVPITNAFTVCTRPIQQRVIQKCSTQIARPDMKQFIFNEQTLQAGVLHTFPSRSLMACSGECSSDNTCVGMSFGNGICTLYM